MKEQQPCQRETAKPRSRRRRSQRRPLPPRQPKEQAADRRSNRDQHGNIVLDWPSNQPIPSGWRVSRSVALLDHAIVHHDARLNPDTTRGPDGQFLSEVGPTIRSLTFAELSGYDVGRLKPRTPYGRRLAAQEPADGARIPRLAEVFDLVRRAGADHIRFNIETKLAPGSHDSPEPEPFAQAVAEAVRAAGMERRVIVQSFDWRTLKAVEAIAPDLARSCLTSEGHFDTMQKGVDGPSPWTAGLDIDRFGGSVTALVKGAGCHVWSPSFRDLTEERLSGAKELGLAVIPWTVNAPENMARLIDWGVDGLITDYPDRARAVMAAKGLPLPPPVALR